MAVSRDAIVDQLLASFAAGRRAEAPYPHWFLKDCVSSAALDEILALPFPAPALGGVSGKREIHNATRRYFDQENMGRFPICRAFNEAFQSREVTGAVEHTFGSRLAGTYLRVEFAQDTDGFWLEPHTDLGVKSFTMLLYASREPAHAGLGTDIYDAEKRHLGRSPFTPGGAMVFVPSKVTYHGFEARPISGVRKSIIINYVTNEWRAREQLAYPDRPVA
ncbi:MAG TPA: 2OG-Fe(II) oxygenase [Hyphomicrobiaceae bacterium]|nr:2OG-Fe(II) oxygenase [Hyphomicrobiaceae bacterium]